MKKLITVLLALAICLGLVACTNSADPTAAPSSAPTGATSDFLVGAIFIGSKTETSGYTYAHHHGIVEAMKQLSIPEENLRIVDTVPEEATAVTNALNTLKNQGCKIIFGISFGYLDAFNEAAQNPDFAGIVLSHATGYLASDGTDAYSTSFNNYFGRIYQARYLAGIAAGLKSLEIGNNNLGYVSAFGTEYAETCSGINAFVLGAQSVNPNAVCYVKTIDTWGNESLEKAAAESLVNTYNVGVISQHCDSAQPQLVAANSSVFGCGYNTDMSIDAPTAHLTAAIWHWDVYYKTAIEAAMTNPATFMDTVGIYYGGLKENFVDISPISANCAAGTADAIDKVRAMIVSGEWDVFTGVKLNITVADGVATVVKSDAALMDNAGNEIVAAGGATLDDGVIKGSMNYFVAGITKQ